MAGRHCYKGIVVSLISAILLISCGGGGGGGGSGSSSSSVNSGFSLVSITISGNEQTARLVVEKNTFFAQAKLWLKKIISPDEVIAGIPSNVALITFTISAPDMVTITRDTLISGQTSITETFSVPNGSNRHFLAEAKNSVGDVLFTISTILELDGSKIDLPTNLNERPTVISTTPSKNKTKVSTTIAAVEVVFSEAMKMSTINENTFTLKDSDGNAIKGVVGCMGTTAHHIITGIKLKHKTTYTATITTGAKDLSGDSLADNYTWTFTTEDLLLDETFNGKGYVVHNGAGGGNGHDQGNSITVDASGRILVAGWGWNAAAKRKMVIWRYNANGTLDTTFNGVGYATHIGAAGGNLYDEGNSITIDTSGRILVAGYSYNAAVNSDMAIWRYNANGTLDTTFNGVGYVSHEGGAGDHPSTDQGKSITIDTSGRILVAGVSQGPGGTDMVIWRYNSNGTLDTTFNGVGYVSHNSAAGGNGYDQGNSIAIDSSGRILVAGWSDNAAGNSDMVIWRYNANGTLDTTFNGVGYVTHNSAAGGNRDDEGKSITIDTSGRILVAGYSYNVESGDNKGNNEDMVIWRYNANGTLDTTFDEVGYVTHNNATGGNGGESCNDYGNSIITDTSGRILVTGHSRNDYSFDMVIWRYKQQL